MCEENGYPRSMEAWDSTWQLHVIEQQVPCYSEAGRGWEVVPQAPLEWAIPGCDPITAEERSAQPFARLNLSKNEAQPMIDAQPRAPLPPTPLLEHSISWGLGAWRSRFPSLRCLRQGLDFCSRTISGLTKVLVRPAMTLHTWSRILMQCISSNRCLTFMAYLDLKALAICWHCYNLLL